MEDLFKLISKTNYGQNKKIDRNQLKEFFAKIIID
jgi:hypothetical protein